MKKKYFVVLLMSPNRREKNSKIFHIAPEKIREFLSLSDSMDLVLVHHLLNTNQ